MVFTIFTEDQYQCVLEYTVSMNASYSEVEAASKSENFISWVVENATNIEVHSMSDFSSNDFAETIYTNGEGKLAMYYIATGEDAKLLPPYNEDEEY